MGWGCQLCNAAIIEHLDAKAVELAQVILGRETQFGPPALDRRRSAGRLGKLVGADKGEGSVLGGLGDLLGGDRR